MEGQLIDAIYNTLKSDSSFKALLGLSSSPTADEITMRIIRGIEPEKTLTGASVPQVIIYIKPGRYSRNCLVFEGKFCLDVYAKSTVQARQIAGRAFELFHDKYIQDANFHSYRSYLAYDADFATGITGVKGYEAIYDVDYLRMN